MNVEQTLKERAKEAEDVVVSGSNRISKNRFGSDGIQCRSRGEKNPSGFDAGSLSYVRRHGGFFDPSFYGCD